MQNAIMHTREKESMNKGEREHEPSFPNYSRDLGHDFLCVWVGMVNANVRNRFPHGNLDAIEVLTPKSCKAKPLCLMWCL